MSRENHTGTNAASAASACIRSDFIKIYNEKTSRMSSINACHDAICKINELKSDAVAIPWKAIANDKKLENVRVILILESPHIDEYSHKDYQAIGPANGKTGYNIKNFWHEIVRKLRIEKPLLSGNDEIIICNSIQFPCSLFKSTKIHRDEVFTEIWKNGGEIDFKRRLDLYKNKNSIIINACTGSIKTKLSLKHLVQKSAEAKFSIGHPSYWHQEKNREIFPWEPKTQVTKKSTKP